ncbi:serine/threonine-protein kinase pim-2-like [Boleophthalmus pectinirostris]|uniref:serine/threonine-protein kinase pim-2-like n=1 Tax=Boleophthalmus pectinirostris TaxID=150288 RepID=UPI00242C6756|nr:serine/threonine-protein kinase pim-2-like [Boleophthalmus pectinirostris]
MAPWTRYIFDVSQAIVQGSRLVFTTGLSLFQTRKRKSSDSVKSDFESKTSCSKKSTLGGETLDRTKRTKLQEEDCTPSIAHSLDCELSVSKTTKKRKATDEGFKPEPKKPRPDESAKVSDFALTYEEHEQLGEGGFGSVFAGVRISDQQSVAIKHMKRDNVEFSLVSIENEVLSVPSEAVLMNKAAPDRHSVGLNPSVTLLDWYLQDEGQEVVLVMERPTPSQDLFDYCQEKGPLTEAHAKELIRQVVNALLDLDSKQIFHRDINMNNLLVQETESGPRIRVIDFGCGCGVQSEPFYSFKGTPEYAPPEAYGTEGYRAAPTSVWQTGALLHELLRSKSDKGFTTRDFMKGFPYISFLSLSGVSQECSDFLRACLALDPNQRIPLDQLSLHPWLSLV